LDLSYLCKYANTAEFFPENSRFDANNDGLIGTPDMLVFLSYYGLSVKNDANEVTEFDGIEPVYNAKEIAISGEYNSLSDFLSEFGYDGIEFIQDSNNPSIPSSNIVNPNNNEYDNIKYNAIKLLHIIVSTNVTKGQLKEKLNSAFVGTGVKEYASRMILSSDAANPMNDVELLRINTDFLLSFLTYYGAVVAEDDVDYNQPVLS
jgi:hypothetical protein